jgi:hypothetical protein
MAKPSGDYTPLGGFVFQRDISSRSLRMTQERFSKIVFSAILITVKTAYQPQGLLQSE